MPKNRSYVAVKLDAIQEAYAEGTIDFAEFERRLEAFLRAEQDDISYLEAYNNAS